MIPRRRPGGPPPSPASMWVRALLLLLALALVVWFQQEMGSGAAGCLALFGR